MKKRMQLNFMAIAMISMIAVLLLTTVVFYNLFQNEVIENLHTCADMLGEDLVNYKDTDRIISQKKVDNIRVTLIKCRRFRKSQRTSRSKRGDRKGKWKIHPNL